MSLFGGARRVVVVRTRVRVLEVTEAYGEQWGGGGSRFKLVLRTKSFSSNGLGWGMMEEVVR